MIPCGRVLARPPCHRRGPSDPSRRVPGPASAAPPPPHGQAAAGASHDSPLCSCRFHVVVTPSAPPGLAPHAPGSVPESPTGRILCSFSPSSHCSSQCCAPKPWTRGSPPAPAGQGALPERAKLARDSAGAGLWTGGSGTTEGGPPWRRPGLCPPTAPFVASSRSPNQQTCKPSTLLISIESKYSNLEFSFFGFFFFLF